MAWHLYASAIEGNCTVRSVPSVALGRDQEPGMIKPQHPRFSREREHHFLKPAQLYPYTYNILRVFQTNKSYFKVSRLDKTYSRKYTATDSRQCTTRNLGNMHELCAKGNTGDS